MNPCLSILQPWAWLIVNGYKDIENRTWATKFRGSLLIHAGKKYSRSEHDAYEQDFYLDFDIQIPPFEQLRAQTGGIVGSARVLDCVREHKSRWKQPDGWGFLLDSQRPLPFVAYRGQLGIFGVPEDALAGATA